MLCKVDDCGREATYKAACLCQKHYFRIRRNGNLDLHKAKPRIEDERGYQFLHAPTHPLISKGQIYMAEHRMMLYAAIGPGPMNCEICGCDLTWATCQTDHIDENPRNNELSNLRPLCRRCNTQRGKTDPVTWAGTHKITYQGETKTPAQWARDPRVQISGRQIVLRKQSGMTDEQALFAPKVTHNGNPEVDRRPRKTQFKHQRANAVAITVGEITKTAAEWSRELGVSVTEAGIIWRIRQGWEPQRAVYQKGRFA